jgi:hypothetical protein
MSEAWHHPNAADYASGRSFRVERTILGAAKSTRVLKGRDGLLSGTIAQGDGWAWTVAHRRTTVMMRMRKYKEFILLGAALLVVMLVAAFLL